MPYSMNSLPSRSQTWQPSPRTMNGASALGVLVVALRVRVRAARDDVVQAFAEFARQVAGIWLRCRRLHVTGRARVSAPTSTVSL